MIRSTSFKGRRVAVFGLGASGNATALSLMAGGADVAAWDDGEAARAAAASLGIPLVDLAAADWSTFAALVLAPGVPLTHPAPHWTVERAHGAGVEVIGDIELFFRERAVLAPRAPVVAITGTNGKSTTTALTAHLLRALGLDAEMGGNIGKAVLTLAPPAASRIHVLELSSFQIDLTPSLAPTVGVLLNITPDHIERHGSVEQYAAVKERLVTRADAACIGVDDDFTRAIAARLAPSRLYTFSTRADAQTEAAGGVRFHSAGAELFTATGEPIATLADIGALRGEHNAQNALAAVSALRALQDRLDAAGAKQAVWRPEALAGALRTFPGLAHRMEELGRRGRVLFVNDSKATNADSTARALAAWPRDIYWIAGGKAKEGGIAPLAPYFPRLAKAYLIGAATDEFAATLDGAAAYERCGTLERAVAAAARDAAQGTGGEPVVLLSPACASYDQFKNFEERGDRFRAIAAALDGFLPIGRPA